MCSRLSLAFVVISLFVLGCGDERTAPPIMMTMTDAGSDQCVMQMYFPDSDGDGSTAIGASATIACSAPAGYLGTPGTDCDDANASVAPGLPESCNLVDDDCDGEVDEGLPTTTYYPDADGDGFGAFAGIDLCGPLPDGYLMDNTDCADMDRFAYPGHRMRTDSAVSYSDTIIGPLAPDALPFDRNCDGREDRIWDRMAECNRACSAQPTGWLESIPPCGEPGTYISGGCDPEDPSGCETRMFDQGCI